MGLFGPGTGLGRPSYRQAPELERLGAIVGLPSSPYARLFKLLGILVLIGSAVPLLSGDSFGVMILIGGGISAGLIFAVAELQQTAFDIRTIMLREVARLQDAANDREAFDA
jgi:hypothetical protein